MQGLTSAALFFGMLIVVFSILATIDEPSKAGYGLLPISGAILVAGAMISRAITDRESK